MARHSKYAGISPVLKVKLRRALWPPKSLSEKAERKEWNKIINSVSPDWFNSQNLGLLEQYCHHMVAARKLGQQVSELRKLPDYSKAEYFALLTRQNAETRVIVRLLTAMRFTQQSQWDTQKKNNEKAPPASLDDDELPYMVDEDDAEEVTRQ
jgi:hypothetical protein